MIASLLSEYDQHVVMVVLKLSGSDGASYVILDSQVISDDKCRRKGIFSSVFDVIPVLKCEPSHICLIEGDEL